MVTFQGDTHSSSTVAGSDAAPERHRFKGLFAPSGLLRPFRLLRYDLGNLRGRYVSDWTVFNQLVIASAVYVFFTNLLPGITFANDLFVLTRSSWGTIEIVLSTGMCGIIFSLFSIQPLTILGITGPFSVLAENMYTLCIDNFKIPFLPFMAWSLIHTGWLHYVLAVMNAHDWTMKYVTTFSTEIFSLLNSVIYFHKAVQELQRAHENLSLAAFLYSVIGAVGTMLLAIFLSTAERWKPLFHRYIRLGLSEYAAAISIILFIGLPHIGELETLDKTTLHVSTSFRPTSPDRHRFLVEFWDLPVRWVFAAMIPALIITMLFFFDHEISSIICTIDRYNTRKSGGFSWDIVLLGTTTALCGILGIPPSNGLLPQAPLHSESLMHTEERKKTTMANESEKHKVEEFTCVYEQRWSAFLHAVGIMLFVSPPFMKVLGLTPTSVLSGLFLFMGQQSLSVNPVLYRAFNIISSPSELPRLPPSLNIPNQSLSHPELPITSSFDSSTPPPQRPSYLPIHAYTTFQIVITAAIFILTLSPGAPAFPVLIILLVPFRLTIMKRWWRREVLRFVDAWACRKGTPEDDEDADKGAEGEEKWDSLDPGQGGRLDTSGEEGMFRSENGGVRRLGRVPSRVEDVLEFQAGRPSREPAAAGVDSSNISRVQKRWRRKTL